MTFRYDKCCHEPASEIFQLDDIWLTLDPPTDISEYVANISAPRAFSLSFRKLIVA